jgi:transposase, IS5 family
MRKIFERQLKIGQMPIEEIEIDVKSRDELPKLLQGLQAIYENKEVMEKVGRILLKLIPDNVDPKKGRKGMDLWTILVLGCVRLCCNFDYDKLKEVADNHYTLRQMLGHTPLEFDVKYPLQTLKDNIMKFTEEVLNEINTVVVLMGHEIFRIKDKAIHAACDSFVVELHVHFPTDINLLWDALRKTMTLTMRLCDDLNIKGWREGESNLKKIKKQFLKIQRMKHSSSKDPAKKQQRDELIIDSHLQYLKMALCVIEKARYALENIETADFVVDLRIKQIAKFIRDAEYQISLIERRVVNGESIPHHEKVFSIFQQHVEWISKGKSGKPVELGLRVCVVKDQFGLILHHRVMQNETDDKVAVPIMEESLELFPNISSCSFDKGYHSPDNQERLAELLDDVYMRRKGRLSAINKVIEQSPEFREAQRKHSSVESAISALDNHGLDRCRDHGVEGFKRYVALGVLARNIQIIGHALQQKELKKEQRRRKKLALAA